MVAQMELRLPWKHSKESLMKLEYKDGINHNDIQEINN